MKENNAARKDIITFLQGFLKDPGHVGYIFPSSRFLERRLVKSANIESAQCVVELGAGTGGTTKAILNSLPPEGNLLAIENMQDFIPYLEAIQDPRLKIFQDDALHLGSGISSENLPSPDTVISGIPFSTMGREHGIKVLQKVKRELRPQGLFVAYQFRDRVSKLGNEIFGTPRVNLELLNFPPMRVYIWKKNA